MSRTIAVTIGCAAVLALATGCGTGKYTIQFQVSEVINVSEGKPTGDQLPVDIISITADEASRHPDVVDGRLRSDRWFNLRMTNDPQLPPVPPARIYSLRPDIDRLRGTDTRLGDALVGARFGRPMVEVQVEHPQPGNKNAAIVIYGWFKERGRDANKPPLVIRPPGAFKTKLLQVRVGPDSLECVNCP